MSVAVMAEVWRLALPSHLKLTLLAFADHADDRGVCFPSKVRIALKSGISARTVQRHIGKLKERGVLRVVEERDGQTDVFRVVPSAGEFIEEEPAEVDGGDKVSPAENGGGDADDSSAGDTSVPRVESPVSPSSKPSKNHQEEPSEVHGGDSPPPSPEQEDLFREPSGNGRPAVGSFPTLSDLPRDERTNHRIYPDAFERCWEEYPDRNGGNAKGGAYKAWRARTEDGWDPERLLRGTKAYALYCEISGDAGTKYVKQAATFWGPEEHFDENWAEQAREAEPEDPDVKMRQQMRDALRWAEEQDREHSDADELEAPDDEESGGRVIEL